jgi:hypothetical protein
MRHAARASSSERHHCISEISFYGHTSDGKTMVTSLSQNMSQQL